ncbi:MAG: hypothetical protein ABS43_25620 [Bordetella sp. SCN 67-23]|nr:VOC family protein [Burkholderiales bacterium]ODS69462.1 MAG: hypothetical protein ABS43_25620 [Bordetella sp. SCN 67-23]ODU76603.1 MAG: hypothetical protein ABT00_15100 [Bordetella sp. SCN 68-11]OJW92296.1 MAG: hypothetical protein BGO71_07300 [Burkholderiales bacterium 67-32]
MAELRVDRLLGYGLEVPDLAVAAHFYSAFGLTPDSAGHRLALTSRAGGAPEIVAIPGREKRLHHLSFAVAPDDLDRHADHLARLGTPCTTPPFGALREGLWFQDPWGLWLNLAPAAPLPAIAAAATGPRVDRHLWRELNREIRPNRLGHILMFTSDWEKTEAYYARALGLRTSDRAAGKVAFMAGGTGVRDHHCFGLINSTHRGFQHASFHVDSIDDIGFGALQMHKAGYREGFGIGRHALASNLFHYTRDPWGSWVEYYADMDKISESWEARDWNDLPYIWPAWAPEFWGKEMNGNFEPR